MEHYFDILAPPGDATIPLVVHVPHSSTRIFKEARSQLAFTDDELDTELLVITDGYIDGLYQPTLKLGELMFANRTSRLVINPERFQKDENELMSAFEKA